MDQQDPLFERHAALLAAACALAQQQLAEQGFDPTLMPTCKRFSYRQQPDPFTGEATLNGHWAAAQSQRRAQLVVNADGSLLLECDLLCPHPGVPGRWAEQISVWGRGVAALKGEISLLAQLEE